MLVQLFILLAIAAGCINAAPPTPGTPYLDARVTFTDTTFDDDHVKTKVFDWLVDNSVAWKNGGETLTLSDVVVAESNLVAGGVQNIKLALSSSFGNVAAYSAWTAIDGPFVMGGVALDAGFIPNSAGAVENAVPMVTVGLDTMVAGYDNSWARGLKIITDHTPLFGNTVQITLACTSPSSCPLQFDSSVHDIAYPTSGVEPDSASFAVRAPMGTYTISLAVTGGSDSSGRYTIDSTLHVLTIGPKLDVIIDEPVLATFGNALSADYTIQVPPHRDASLDLVVTVIPSAGIAVFPPNNTISGPGINSTTFQVKAALPGVYSLTYVIDDPWMTANGWVGLSNTDFNTPTFSTPVVVIPNLNITINSISVAYFINDPVGDWGGAFSEQFLVHIQKPVRTLLKLTPTAAGVSFDPTSVVFMAGETSAAVTARALTKGNKMVTFIREGADASIYADPVPRLWLVQGPNQFCYNENTESGCWSRPSCQWDASNTNCTNQTLPMFLSPVPELFNLEESRNISLTLATPARGGLTVQLTNIGSGRLTFNTFNSNPNQLIFAPGETTVNFTITGTLGASDGRVRQSFLMALGGSDTQIFTQSEAWADIRPRIQCVATPPQSFFVGTESQEFQLTCDTDPEQDVIFTPGVLPGISWIPVGGNAGDNFTMLPGTSVAGWVAASTTLQVGSFLFTVSVSGTNAERYTIISTVAVTVLPSGELNIPPSFYLTAFDMSPFFHCDITVQPPSVLEVTITVHERESGVETTKATVSPTLLKYNNTKRSFLRAVSDHPGNYTLIFSISGVNKRNYKVPEPLDFEVKPRLDGKAFEARTTAGFTPDLRCRIQVGFQSMAYKGQAAIAGTDHFCSTYTTPSVNATVNCSIHQTDERCRNEMETTGNACVWHQDECQFLSSMQGIVKQVAFGSGFTVMLTTEGRVFTIGSTKYGQLGHYNADDVQEVTMPESIVTISAGTSHTLALSNEGRLYSWGANYKGQLGQNSRVKQTEIVARVVFPKGANVTCISSGTLHSGALTTTGQIFMWGSNEYGQLGSQPSYRSITLAPTAVRRDYFGGEPALALQCGEYYTMVGTAVTAYTFGSNTMGQLGREGFDEWMPGPPVHYFQNKEPLFQNSQPAHPSWITGRDNC